MRWNENGAEDDGGEEEEKRGRRGPRKRERAREGIRRTDRRIEGREEIARGERGEHPRGAQAPCEGGKAGESCSLRPGRLAVLSSGGSERAEGGCAQGWNETGCFSWDRREERAYESVRARRRRRGEPLEKPGREGFAADPLVVARARQSTFSARKSRCRARGEPASGNRWSTLKRSACWEKERDREEEGRVRRRGTRLEVWKFRPGRDAQGWWPVTPQRAGGAASPRWTHRGFYYCSATFRALVSRQVATLRALVRRARCAAHASRCLISSNVVGLARITLGRRSITRQRSLSVRGCLETICFRSIFVDPWTISIEISTSEFRSSCVRVRICARSVISFVAIGKNISRWWQPRPTDRSIERTYASARESSRTQWSRDLVTPPGGRERCTHWETESTRLAVVRRSRPRAATPPRSRRRSRRKISPATTCRERRPEVCFGKI